MKMNFKGLVSLHTLPKTTPLLPLYEAVINSIQSIEDAHITNGKIEIVIEREKQMNLFEIRKLFYLIFLLFLRMKLLYSFLKH